MSLCCPRPRVRSNTYWPEKVREGRESHHSHICPSICFQFCNRFVLSFNKILANYSHWCLVDVLEGQKHMGFWLNCVVVIMYFLRHRQCFNPAAKCLNISTSHGEQARKAQRCDSPRIPGCIIDFVTFDRLKKRSR